MAKLRNASSLILAARNSLSDQSIKIVALKRSAEMAHMPNAYVFPGGNADAADEHPDWLSLLSPSERDVHLNIVSKEENHPIASLVSKAISLRITAIRETFEECGILLCKRKTDKPSHKVTHYEIDDKNSWRNKIRKNPYEFLNLCRAHDCFPNIKCLYLLSNWITPRMLERRYDCKFFIAVIEGDVEVEADGIEAEKVEWQPVSYLINNTDFFLPPPQTYELTKLRKFNDIETFCKFAVDMDSYECESFIPTQVYTSDGFVIILPGDEKYEELFNNTNFTVEVKCDTLHFRGQVMHRLEYLTARGTANKGKLVIQNCYPRFHDLLNVTFPSKNSKL